MIACAQCLRSCLLLLDPVKEVFVVLSFPMLIPVAGHPTLAQLRLVVNMRGGKAPALREKHAHPQKEYRQAYQ